LTTSSAGWAASSSPANIPNRAGATADNKNVTTARQVVEKTRDLAQKIAQAKASAGSKADVETSPIGGEVKVVEKTKADDDDDDGCVDSTSSPQRDTIKPAPIIGITTKPRNRLTAFVERVGALVTGGASDKPEGELQSEAEVMQQFNAQFEHFQDDAPACDICGSITVRNGTCYKCFNCGNSMGCS
jgi:hypothetical protein